MAINCTCLFIWLLKVRRRVTWSYLNEWGWSKYISKRTKNKLLFSWTLQKEHVFYNFCLRLLFYLYCFVSHDMKMLHEDIIDFYSFLNFVHNSYDFTDDVQEWDNLNDAIWVTLSHININLILQLNNFD